MLTDNAIEMAIPVRIREGDVIEDPSGPRWLTVNGIQVLSGNGSGLFSFYDSGTDDRVTFGGSELVKRKRRAS